MYHYVYKHKHLFCFQQGFYSNAKKGQASSSSSSPTTSNESVSPKAASFVVKRTYIVTTDQNKPFSETPSPNNYITWDLHNHMMFFFSLPPQPCKCPYYFVWFLFQHLRKSTVSLLLTTVSWSKFKRDVYFFFVQQSLFM